MPKRAPPPEIAAVLLKGEEARWWGRPAQGIVPTRMDIVLVPLSVLGLVPVGLAFGPVLAGGRGGTVGLYLAMFLAIGLAFAFGRFLLDAWLRSRVRYAVTDRRALILGSWPVPALTAVDVRLLPVMVYDPGLGGKATIRFGEPPRRGFPVWGRRSPFERWDWVPSLNPVPQFLHVPDAARVHALLRDIQDGHREGGSGSVPGRVPRSGRAPGPQPGNASRPTVPSRL